MKNLESLYATSLGLTGSTETLSFKKVITDGYQEANEMYLASEESFINNCSTFFSVEELNNEQKIKMMNRIARDYKIGQYLQSLEADQQQQPGIGQKVVDGSAYNGSKAQGTVGKFFKNVLQVLKRVLNLIVSKIRNFIMNKQIDGLISKIKFPQDQKIVSDIINMVGHVKIEGEWQVVNVQSDGGQSGRKSLEERINYLTGLINKNVEQMMNSQLPTVEKGTWWQSIINWIKGKIPDAGYVDFLSRISEAKSSGNLNSRNAVGILFGPGNFQTYTDPTYFQIFRKPINDLNDISAWVKNKQGAYNNTLKVIDAISKNLDKLEVTQAKLGNNQSQTAVQVIKLLFDACNVIQAGLSQDISLTGKLAIRILRAAQAISVNYNELKTRTGNIGSWWHGNRNKDNWSFTLNEVTNNNETQQNVNATNSDQTTADLNGGGQPAEG